MAITALNHARNWSGMIEIHYDDPLRATPGPNHIFPLVFQSLTARLSTGGNTPSREFSPAEARSRFGADWAAAAGFDAEPAFGGKFQGELMLALPRNRLADAYVLFLFNGYQAAKARINANLGTLSFAQSDTVLDPARP